MADPAGNHYDYNLLGQLTGFVSHTIGVKASYQYYANGLRAQKSVTSSSAVDPIDYYYDAAKYANIVNERQGALSTSYLLPQSHMVRYVNDGKGNVTKQIAIHGTKDVEAILGQNGNIQKTYHYSPNGIIEPIDRRGQVVQIVHLKSVSLSIIDNPFQYSDEYCDLESGLDYLRARYYDPQIQRFIQRDSCQLLNRYAYVKDDPVMDIDPSGHHNKAVDLGLNILTMLMIGGLTGGFSEIATSVLDRPQSQEADMNKQESLTGGQKRVVQGGNYLIAESTLALGGYLQTGSADGAARAAGFAHGGQAAISNLFSAIGWNLVNSSETLDRFGQKLFGLTEEEKVAKPLFCAKKFFSRMPTYVAEGVTAWGIQKTTSMLYGNRSWGKADTVNAIFSLFEGALWDGVMESLPNTGSTGRFSQGMVNPIYGALVNTVPILITSKATNTHFDFSNALFNGLQNSAMYAAMGAV